MPQLPDSLSWWSIALALVGVVGVIWAIAITRQGRQREHEVMRLSEEAHRIKDEFVAMVSHELRTPLTSIAGFADTLVESWKELPDEEVDEFLGIINRQSMYLGDLVEDVLVIPRLEADRLRFHPELFDLGRPPCGCFQDGVPHRREEERGGLPARRGAGAGPTVVGSSRSSAT